MTNDQIFKKKLWKSSLNVDSFKQSKIIDKIFMHARSQYHNNVKDSKIFWQIINRFHMNMKNDIHNFFFDELVKIWLTWLSNFLMSKDGNILVNTGNIMILNRITVRIRSIIVRDLTSLTSNSLECPWPMGAGKKRPIFSLTASDLTFSSSTISSTSFLPILCLTASEFISFLPNWPIIVSVLHIAPQNGQRQVLINMLKGILLFSTKPFNESKHVSKFSANMLTFLHDSIDICNDDQRFHCPSDQRWMYEKHLFWSKKNPCDHKIQRRLEF